MNEKSWDPQWQEVIVLLAGRLDDPGPLLAVLTNGDDEIHSRTVLAALGLSEIPEAKRRKLKPRIAAITKVMIEGKREESEYLYRDEGIHHRDAGPLCLLRHNW
jgi:hypothetical protein